MAWTPVIVGIDGGLIHKGYHAYSGPNNAVTGLVRVLVNALTLKRPVMAFVAWDTQHTWRHERYDRYKANRAPTPPELLAQLEPAREAVAGLGVANVVLEGYEADDILATLAERAKARHLPSCIITGDTDLCQLIDKDTEVRLIPSGGGFGVTEIMTADRWERKKGYPPHLIAEFKALAGDPSDNIPGFKGVGKKTALALLKEYGDLDGVLKNAWQIKGAIGRRIYYGNDEALLWKELTTVCREAPVEITAGELKWQFDPHRACACLERLSVLDEGLRGKLMRLAGTVSETKRSAG